MIRNDLLGEWQEYEGKLRSYELGVGDEEYERRIGELEEDTNKNMNFIRTNSKICIMTT